MLDGQQVLMHECETEHMRYIWHNFMHSPLDCAKLSKCGEVLSKKHHHTILKSLDVIVATVQSHKQQVYMHEYGKDLMHHSLRATFI